MTRKQALELAVQALAGNEEAVQVLHSRIDELPLKRRTSFTPGRTHPSRG